MSWGFVPQSFKVSAGDIAAIVNAAEQKAHDSHKEEIPNTLIDLRHVGKVDPEHVHILQLLKWLEVQRSWLKSKDVGSSSFDLEEIPPIPELEARPTEKPPVKPLDKQKLDRDTAQQLLKRGIAMQAAVTGYSFSQQIPLDTLVDVTAEYITNMGKLYLRNLENEKMGVSTGFSDPFERTLYEMDVPGIRELDLFYRNRVSNYRRKLIKKCEDLKHECEEKANQIYGGFGIPEEQNPVRSTEPLEAAPTFSFTDDASNESAPQLRLGDAAIPGLEQGLRMLQSLEEGMDFEF